MVGDLGTISSLLKSASVHLNRRFVGNIEVGDDGVVVFNMEDRQVKLIGPHSIIGRSIVIKANEDDLGRGGHEYSLTTGNSGSRIAGGVVGIASS